MSKFITRFGTVAALALPLLASAQDLNTFLNTNIRGILNTIITFLIALATFVLIWGIFQYVTAAGDEEKVKEGRRYILWGVIGVALMITVQGLIGLLVGIIGNDAGITSTSLSIPSL